MPVTGIRGFTRSIRGSLGAAAILLAFDGALEATPIMSSLFCPIWFVISLWRSLAGRPGWGLALVRISIPALTLGIVWVNSTVQLGIAEANARRVIAACEAYHAATGNFPAKLDELVPRYLDAVPHAKYCLGTGSVFHYYNLSEPSLYWHVFGFTRKIYNFNGRRWSYLD